MGINYTSSAGNGLFDVLGKGFAAIDAINTARGTTAPGSIVEVLRQFANIATPSRELRATLDGLLDAANSQARGQDGAVQTIRQNLQAYLIQSLNEYQPQPSLTIGPCLDYLIEQMRADGYYVNSSAVSAALWTTAGNTGDPAIAYAVRRGDGRTQQHVIPETITITTTSAGTAPTLRFQAPVEEGLRLSEGWPKGSGADESLTATAASGGLLTNGDFEDATLTNIPDGWTIDTGTPGTHFKITLPAQQIVTISGTPTAGGYQLRYTDAAGVVRTTATLAYDAAESTIQAALRALPGLSAVTVSSSGDSPNYAHTITFTGVAGPVTNLSAVSLLDTGSIAIASSRPGEEGPYQGAALKLIGDNSTLHAIHQPLSLEAETVYFVHLRIRRKQVGTGVLKVELVDGIGGNITADAAGNSNALTIDLATLSGGHDSQWASFRITKATAANPVYLRIRASTALSSGLWVYLDDVCLIDGTELYPGGPFVAVFGGKTASLVGDSWTMIASNDRDGFFQEWFDRCFDTSTRRQLLPASGTTLINESIVTAEESSSSSSQSNSSSSSCSSSSSISTSSSSSSCSLSSSSSSSSSSSP